VLKEVSVQILLRIVGAELIGVDSVEIEADAVDVLIPLDLSKERQAIAVPRPQTVANLKRSCR
jgi:hypothetical protein